MTREEMESSGDLAPGWQIRCVRCGFTDALGKYGIRLGACSIKKYTFGRCPRCRRLTFLVVEQDVKRLWVNTKGKGTEKDGV